MNAYLECPTIKTKSFTIRLIRKADSESLFQCYNDERAVCLMNDDNCDFGFYVESREKMLETIGYWLDFYEKQYFIRFSIVDNATDKAVGTIEGFVGETGAHIVLSIYWVHQPFPPQNMDETYQEHIYR